MFAILWANHTCTCSQLLGVWLWVHLGMASIRQVINSFTELQLSDSCRFATDKTRAKDWVRLRSFLHGPSNMLKGCGWVDGSLPSRMKFANGISLPMLQSDTYVLCSAWIV